jgi:predicted Zn-dependent peptidase
MASGEIYHHHWLDCGVEFAALAIDGRRTTAYEIRVLAGLADEPEDRLGLAGVVEETIDKGTEARSAQELTDAFDAIGAQVGSSVGREAIAFRCSCLPEYVEKALALHAEMLRTPAFPEQFCKVAVDLGQQELTALEDDPGELSRKLLAPHAYGSVLGRHELGTRESLGRISRDDVVAYWKRHFSAGRIQFVVGGAVDVVKVTRTVERLFAAWGNGQKDGRGAFAVQFSPGFRHQPKELEQEHILMCWPGLAVTDDAYPVEHLALEVLSGGMSSRLFTEVREKQGLVYWVGAWDEHPRRAGMNFMGASTTPARCEQTYKTLLREVDRLGEDVTQEELDRAKVGVIAKTQTHGDITRARVSELGSDLFHYGRPVPTAEKNAKIDAVTIADVKRYLAEHSRERLGVLTLGPAELKMAKP